MDTLLGNATSSFSTTFGFAISDVVTWAADNLFKVFLGTGLAFLYELRYWIIGTIVLFAIIFFAFRFIRLPGR